jgi:hypothetical protein
VGQIHAADLGQFRIAGDRPADAQHPAQLRAVRTRGHRRADPRQIRRVTREVTVLLADFATVWNALFPAEQARIVQLLVERVNVQEDALEVRIRTDGLVSFVAELRQDERRAA